MRGKVVVTQQPAWIVRTLSENSNAGSGLERQDPVVGQEHDRSRGGLPRQRAVLDRVEYGRRGGGVDVGLLEEAELLLLRQHPTTGRVDSLQRHGTRAHQRGEVPVAPVGGEFHVEPGQQGEAGGVGFVAGAVVEVLQAADPEVVGDRDACEAQFVAE